MMFSRLLASLLGLLLSVGLIEVAARILKIAPMFDLHGVTVRLDPDAGFSVVGNSHPEINRFGFRDPEWGRKERLRIAVLGDSFVFAWDLAIEHTIPRSLARCLDEEFEVLNMGVPGYGPDQAWARLEREGFDLFPDIVVLGLFPANDFADLEKNSLHVFRAGRLEMNTDHPGRSFLPFLRTSILVRRALGYGDIPWEASVRLTAIFGRDGYRRATEKGTRLMRAELRRFRDELAERSIPLLVAVFPSQTGRRENDEVALRLCDDLRISCVTFDLGTDTRFFTDSGHYSPLGTALVAEELARALGPILGRES